MVRRKLISIVFIFISFLTGCWDYKDLDQMSMPIVGIYDAANTDDKTEDKVIVGAIFPILEKDADEKYKIEFIEGQTVGDTREKRAYYSSLSYSAGMLDAAIWGEKMAKQGMDNSIFDSLARVPLIKNTLYMAIVEGNAKELENLKIKEYPDPGLFIIGILKEAKKNSFLPTVTYHEFSVNLHPTGKNPILPIIKMKDELRIEITGTGIFKKDKLINKIDLEETRTLILLRGIKGRGQVPFSIEKNGEIIDKGTVTLKNSRKVKVTRDGDKYTFDVTIQLKGHLMERSSQESFFDENPTIKIEDVEKAIEEEIKKDCINLVKKMQNEFKVDCIDITKYALAKWRNELMDKVEVEFIENVEINVNVEVRIDRIGDLT